MKRAGLIFSALGLLQAIVLMIVGRDQTYLLASFGVCFALGAILLGIDGVHRLANGQIKLRPFAAAKITPILFALMSIVSFLIGLVFPNSERSLAEIVMVAFLFAVFFSLYSTAYRKPE